MLCRFISCETISRYSVAKINAIISKSVDFVYPAENWITHKAFSPLSFVVVDKAQEVESSTEAFFCADVYRWIICTEADELHVRRDRKVITWGLYHTNSNVFVLVSLGPTMPASRKCWAILSVQTHTFLRTHLETHNDPRASDNAALRTRRKCL